MSDSVRRGLVVMSRSMYQSYGWPVPSSSAVQTVLIDSHLRHAVAAQFLAARQEDDFRVLGGNQFGQLRAVGV